MNEYTPPTIERIRDELPELTKEIRKRASIIGAETTAGQLNGWVFSAELADLFDRWLAEHDREIVARTLAAQSTGGVCQVNDPDLEWRGWVEEATALIKGEEQ